MAIKWENRKFLDNLIESLSTQYMQDGRFHIKFQHGEITGYATSAGLEVNYNKIFCKAKEASKRNPHKIENGIEVIIFGTFYLESIINILYKEILDSKIESKTLTDSLWEATKRLSIREKLIISVSDLPQKIRTEADKYLGKIQRIFDIRNKLAHFKDKEIEIKASQLSEKDKTELSINTFGAFIDSIPDPDIILELKGQKLQNNTRVIEEIKKWIEKLLSHVIKRRKISNELTKLLKKEMAKQSKGNNEGNNGDTSQFR